MSREIDVAAVEDVPEGEAIAFALAGDEIVLCNVDGEIYALQSMCSHEDLPLEGGEIEDGILTCDWHGAEFDVCTGGARGLPATRPLRTFPTTVRGGRIYVSVDESTSVRSAKRGSGVT